MKKKFLSLLLAGILMSQTFIGTVPVNAEELEVKTEMAVELEEETVVELEEETTEETAVQEINQNIIKTKNLAEFQAVVLEQQKKLEVLTENESNTVVSNTANVAMFNQEQETATEQELSFEVRTLLVSAEGEIDTKGAVSVIGDSDGLNVLIYETEEETKAAYEYFKELEGNGIESVTVDEVIQVADVDELEEPASQEGSKGTEERNSQNESVKSQLQTYIEENRIATAVKVAVIDTGLDKTDIEYAQLQKRILDTGLNLSTSGGVGDIQDDNGHGTAMVSVIAGMTGENVKLLPIKAANACGQSTMLSTYLALQSAIELQVDVVLISMNGRNGSASLLKEAIEYATEQGILVVVSAGNSYVAARTAAMAASLRTFLEDRTAVEEALLSYAQDMGEEGFDEYYGNGYLGEEQIVEVRSEESETASKMEDAYFSLPIGGETNVLSTSAVTATKGHHVEYCNTAKKHTSFHWGNEDEVGVVEICEDGGEVTSYYYYYYTECNNKNKNVTSVCVNHCSKGHATVFIGLWNQYTVYQVIHLSDWTAANEDIAVKNAKAKVESETKSVACEGYLVKNTYTMAYDANGGSGTIKSGTATYGDKYTISSATNFSRTGYTFNGYYIKRKSDGKIWGGSTNKWVKESSTNEGKYKIYGRGKKVTVGSALVSDNTSLTTDTFTFVAAWEKNTYTIEYNKNGATSGSMDSTNVKYGEKFTITKNKFTKTGHTFKGYYVKRASDSKWYCGSTNKWQSPADINAHSYIKTLFADDGKERTMNTTWIRSDQGADTFTFYAVWEANSYTVTYNANGNVKGTIKGITDSTTTAEVTYGKAISLSKKAVPTDSYYTFVGWSTSKYGETLSSLKMGAKDITLYAVYSPPVSDIKEVYLFLWDRTNKTKTARYDLTKTGNVSSPVKGYNYELSKIKYTSLLSGTAANDIRKALVAVDNAGNVTVVPLDANPPIPEYFNQTVKHLFQNLDTGRYDEKETMEASVSKGGYYTPQALSPLPTGYKLNSTSSTGIGKTYQVTAAKITYAYYDAIPYKLTFEPNGGTIVDGDNSKTVYTGRSYDYLPGDKHAEFPNVTKEGYSFTGWYTSKTGGTRVYPTTIYKLTTDSTIYAQWEVNSYKVTYDYWTNGGTAAWKTAGQTSYTTEVEYGKTVDVNVLAEKEGWTHVGWSLFSDDTTEIKQEEAPKMGMEDIILYAVYKKDITATYIDRNAAGIQTRSETKTIYNREEGIHVILPEQNVWTERKNETSWEAEGWCPVENNAGELPDAETPATVMAGTSMVIKNDISFYGRYSKKVTISYDTNGSPEEIPEETKTRYYNASGVYQNPLFTLADAPTLPKNSFVYWTAADTTESGEKPMMEYAAGQTTEFTEDTLLTAKWDAYPEIEAYDRYFTLEQAKSGEITPTALLEKVKGTDKEDGTLKNGTDVVVINYRPEDFSGFTADGSISVTYQAADSFGNVVTKTVMVHISDLTPQEIQIKKYVRFISTRFYKAQKDYVSVEQGGLENASVWKQNPAYKAVLERALDNKKINETVINTEVLGQEREVVKPGSGAWEHETQTWVFSKKEVQEVKEFLSKNGLGNYQNSDGIEKFFRQFSGDRE